MSQNKFSLETRETVLWLKAHTTLPEDLNFIPRDHIGDSQPPEPPAPEDAMHTSCLYRYPNTYALIKNKLKIFPPNFLFLVCLWREWHSVTVIKKLIKVISLQRFINK